MFQIFDYGIGAEALRTRFFELEAYARVVRANMALCDPKGEDWLHCQAELELIEGAKDDVNRAWAKYEDMEGTLPFKLDQDEVSIVTEALIESGGDDAPDALQTLASVRLAKMRQQS